MSDQSSRTPMLEMYIFENSQMIELLENVIMECEKENCYSENAVNEIFRHMHTIKGSSAMMMFNDVADLSHSIEDLFYFLRERKPEVLDCSALSDIVLEGVDFIKEEIEKIKEGKEPDGDATLLNEKIKEFLTILKAQNPSEGEIEKPEPEKKKKQQYYIAPEKQEQGDSDANYYKVTLFLEEDCEMEDVRCYTLTRDLAEHAQEIYHTPENLIDDDNSAPWIKENGFIIYLKSESSYEQIDSFFKEAMFIREYVIIVLENSDEFAKRQSSSQEEIDSSAMQIAQEKKVEPIEEDKKKAATKGSANQGFISVGVEKLDKLMDMVGEMVIAEAMVTQNPEVINLGLESFQQSARHLRKITSELQEMVMSIRMVPLSTTFIKMHRIVRDITKRQGKEVQLKIIGEETEVDKNIIEHIGDPLMHLIRNAIDHGIESSEERLQKGKNKEGTVIIEAKNSGSDVFIILKDDGKGLNKEKILKKAKENGILEKDPEDMTDKEIYNLILLPGFSTKEQITEFSGRGVGMDVVLKNLELVGGSVSVDSEEEVGTTITLKIPLTLAIFDGMNIKVGSARYTIPILNIKESFRPRKGEVFKDPNKKEMIMVRGYCYRIIRLHQKFKVNTEITEYTDGILVMVEQDEKKFCMFADELLGQQQVVVKSLPNYIKRIKKIEGIAGCTLLGDGSISLILDVGGLASLP